MKRKEIKVPVLILMLFLSILSCKKDSVTHDVAADVYVKSILNDGEPVFGLVQYAAGSSAISAVAVSNPNGIIEQLSAYDANKLTYYFEPTLALGGYSTTPPIPGTYSFGITFTDGVEKVVTNTLGAVYLLPANITSLVKLTDSQTVRLTWDAVTGVQYYQLSIIKTGSNVYTSQLFTPPTGNTVDIPISLIVSFTGGTYTYQLDAIKYESAESGLVQSISSASADVDL